MAEQVQKSLLRNLIKTFTEDEQKKVASECCEDYDRDLEDRSDWEAKRNRWYKLWMNFRDPKSTPWPGASNICVPIVTAACNQFHSRAYQTVFAAPGLVKVLPVSENDRKRSKVVEEFMNWQTLYEMEDYEDEFDRLLLHLPLNGVAVKKVWYDPLTEQNVAENVSALDFIVPFKTKKLKKAKRITHRLWMHYEEIEERFEAGLFANFDKITTEASEKRDESQVEVSNSLATGEKEPIDPEDSPKCLLEVHKLLKFPDGIKRPVILTVDYDSQTLLRVQLREVTLNGKKHVLNYFTDYHFIPNPEGYYSFGFGHFLEQLNEMANTAFNQIFDAGRLSNSPFFFFGRRAGFRNKNIELMPGKGYEVNDVSQLSFPQMQRLDQALFSVLGLLGQYSEQISSTSDYLLGREAKGVKTPTATGTLAIIEQGLVVFGTLTKRMFRSLRGELKQLFILNSLFLPEAKQFRITGSTDLPFPTIKREDFDGHYDLIPIGDPSYASRQSRRQEAVEMYQIGINEPLIASNPVARWHLVRNIYETYDAKIVNDILPPLPEQPMLPETENAMFMQGDYHAPLPGENHNMHLAIHEQFENTPFYKQMSEERKTLHKKHKEQTRALQALEMMMQQQLGSQVTQPQQEAPTGEQQGV